MGFVHLHLHTEYSLLDGVTPVRKLFKHIKDQGMNAVAITEHGNMLSFVLKYLEAQKQGIKLIFGVETYLVDDVKKKDKSQKKHHLLLLAKNQEGFKNLVKLVSDSYKEEHFYYTPRIDKKILRQYASGLICTSGCLAAELPHHLLHDNDQLAEQKLQEYLEIFDKEDFYIELQHHKLPEQEYIMPKLLALAKKYDLKCIATNDAHYLTKDDAKSQEVMLCIQTKTTLHDEKRMKFSTEEFYVKNEQEMREIFDKISPGAIENTVEIAQRCNVSLTLNEHYFPEFPLPDGYTDETYLKQLCQVGLENKYKNSPRYKEAEERLDFELSVINKMGFAKYFLIVQDFIAEAKKFCQVGPGRGSGAGSIVAYILGITQLEPLSLGLLFERFLNPDRVSLPDFDVDFGDKDRVLDYVVDKYGKEKVALIGTVGTMQAKAVIKDVARAMNIPFSISNEITKYVTERTIEKSLEAKDGQARPVNPELKVYQEKYPELFEIAMRLEGTVRHTGVHACGVAWGPKPITEYTPVFIKDNQTVVQIDMNEVEKIGLVKFDFLGLETLNVIDQVLNYIQKDNQWLEAIPLDDDAVYEILRAGESIGVFQLESQGMQKTLQKVAPTQFDDLIAIVSLYRPGPMQYLDVYARRKHGLEKVRYVHPAAEEILKPTYGIMVYQEQVMQLSVALANFSKGESDVLRKAIGKKILELMQSMEAKFKDGCKNHSGMSDAAVNKLWDDIVEFASYSFNKSHAAAYALIAYRTAYLKKYYPVEFMAALVSSVIKDPDRMSFYLQTAKSMGIEILSPDINKSDDSFTIEEHKIRFGLSGIKHVGHAAIEEIKAKRTFKDLEDFVSKVDLAKINKRVIETLIKAGCFDESIKNRNQLLAVYETMMKNTRESGQMTLFGTTASSVKLPDLPALTLNQRLSHEKEVLGVFVSGHPLDQYANHGGLTKLDNLKDGYDAQVMGIITKITTIHTKNGDQMAFVSIADRMHAGELVVFPNVYNELDKKKLIEGACIFCEGKVDQGKILANRITFVPPKK